MPKNTVSATTRLTITLSKEADLALRTYLGSQGMKKGDLSKFIEDSVRWRIFQETVRDTRKAFSDVSAEELQKLIDDAVDEVRAANYRKHG
jgi:Ribbon-helix-helix domain